MNQENKTPFFSIVITSYNRAYCIENTLNSILNQSFTDFEIILVDDCSTDNTEEIVSNYDVRFIKTDINTGGPARPRNLGFQNSKGKWVCFCDSDDLFSKNHLSNIYDCIKSNNLNNNIITTNAFVRKNKIDYEETYFKDRSNKYSKISFGSNYIVNKSILSSLCIRNKDAIDFREEDKYKSFEDYIFLLENISNGKIHYYINDASIRYNVESPDSIRLLQKTEWEIFKAKSAVLTRTIKYIWLYPLVCFVGLKFFLRHCLIKLKYIK